MLRPLVKSHNGKKRTGKGFSIEELKALNLNIEKAKRLKISIDKRRKTVHEENINKLKELLEKGGLNV